MGNILIIDDDKAVYKILLGLSERMGHSAVWRSTLGDGLVEVEENAYDAVFLDVNLPDGSGLDIIAKIRGTASAPEVVILTGYGNVDGAAIAIQNGAWDYIQKSAATHDITLAIKRVMEYRKEKRQHRPEAVALDLGGIVGDSAPMRACYNQLAACATKETNVLVSGETGTGKEIFARAVHNNSARARGSLVVVDCAALPETLVESLLFGHEKGVYTGATTAREGLVAQADGGTLFLDEVGELSPAIQKVFLRVLQERKYRPVGGRSERASNFRLVAATNRDLDEMVAAGDFRQDLLYRLRSVHITLPPLRDREADIKKLVSHYLSIIGDRYGTGSKGVSADFLETVEACSWPGNVRQLISALESAVSNAGPEATLFARHLPQDIRLEVIQGALKAPSGPEPAADANANTLLPGAHAAATSLTTYKRFRKAAISDAERAYLSALLEKTEKDLHQSLDISGLSRSRFYDLLRQHNLSL